MIVRNRLRNRSILLILSIVALMFATIYLYSVPLLRTEVYKIERNSARLALDNVYQLASKMYAGLDTYQEQALDSHKQRLKAIVELSATQIAAMLDAGAEPREIYQFYSNYLYESDSYVWITRLDGKVLAHPDSRLINRNLNSEPAPEFDTLRYISQQVDQFGETFVKYRWRSPETGEDSDKVSFVKSYPGLGLTVGSGLYLSSLDAEVAERRRLVVDELRSALSEIRIARTGYMFVFDEQGEMLFHPNANLDRGNATGLINPSSGGSILAELRSVADTGEELVYKWDRPNDPGNYIYEKISLVRKIDELGWYICSSVYVDELQSSAVTLSQRLITMAVISMLISFAIGMYFLARILDPVRRLAKVAQKVKQGDFSARSGIVREDEVGVLAATFDAMVRRIDRSLRDLGSEVEQKNSMVEQLEGRQTLILDALPVQVAYLDADLKFLFVNKDYAAMFGRSKEQVVGRRVGEIVPPAMMAEIAPRIQRCLKGEEVVFDYRFALNGDELISKRRFIPDLDAQGRVVGILNLSLDITAEKETERQLLEASRMTAAGQLAGGLTHDFNNLLTVILGNLISARERYAGDPELVRSLDPAIRASRRGAEIIRRLMTFARAQAHVPTEVRVDEAISGVCDLIQSSLPASINLVIERNCQARVAIDLGQFENALVNLALNARDSMPDGGELCFAVQPIEVDKLSGFDEPVPPGRYVRIDVIDQGTGFSDEALNRAFEPFFTTKTVGKGSGLGLSMVYGFTKQSGGYLAISNNSQRGARVSLLLPVVAASLSSRAESEGSAERPLNPAFQGQLVLLVEDDLDVRQVVRELLTSMGFVIVEASEPDEALALIDALPDIRVLVSDIDLPGTMNGIDLARCAAQSNGECVILLMSGNARYLQVADAVAYPVLLKPFGAKELIDALNRAYTSQGDGVE